jgi:hypothetical protein
MQVRLHVRELTCMLGQNDGNTKRYGEESGAWNIVEHASDFDDHSRRSTTTSPQVLLSKLPAARAKTMPPRALRAAN